MLRTFRYAATQARIRARIGAMPVPEQWSQIARSTDIDNMLERMRAAGLAHWLVDMPRRPPPSVIESRLAAQSRVHLADWLDLLPCEWKATRRWVSVLPELGDLRCRLAGCTSESSNPFWAFLDVIEPEARAARLRQSPWAALLGDDGEVYDNWLVAVRDSLPRRGAVETYVRQRLFDLLSKHVAQQRAQRIRPPDRGAASAQTLTPLGELERELRGLLMVADPFHDTLILVYGLLETIQFLRLRRLLLARARSWELAPNEAAA